MKPAAAQPSVRNNETFTVSTVRVTAAGLHRERDGWDTAGRKFVMGVSVNPPRLSLHTSLLPHSSKSACFMNWVGGCASVTSKGKGNHCKSHSVPCASFWQKKRVFILFFFHMSSRFSELLGFLTRTSPFPRIDWPRFTWARAPPHPASLPPLTITDFL